MTRATSPADAPAGAPVADDFVERMGFACEDLGLPRAAGRLLGWLLLHGEASGGTELAEALAVSRASISTNGRLLLERGLIERVGTPGHRQVGYRIADDAAARLFADVLGRLERVRETVARAERTLPPDMEAARLRLASMIRFEERVVDRLRPLLATSRRPAP